MTKLNIVFAGTPAFTLPCLNALSTSRHTLKAVYTQPDRPAGRGRALQESAVKTWAKTREIPIYQPINFKDQTAIDELGALCPDVLVVIAYGLILPPAVLSLPKYGCINVHASLLPLYRGASPIQQAILMGDSETGITVMQMDKGMDTGDILTKASCPIYATDTANELHDRLAELATTPLLTTLDAIAAGQLAPLKQDDLFATNAPKINKSDACINWQQPAINIDRQIRAFNPWPIAFTHANDEIIRIHQASVVSESSNQRPGTILSLNKTGMLVATTNGSILVERLQFPGGKVMTIKDWLNANRNQLYVNLVLQ